MTPSSDFGLAWSFLLGTNAGFGVIWGVWGRFLGGCPLHRRRARARRRKIEAKILWKIECPKWTFESPRFTNTGLDGRRYTYTGDARRKIEPSARISRVLSAQTHR